MTQQLQTPNSNNQDPFISPALVLGLAAIGFVIALVVWLTQPIFSVVGWGGLGLGVIALVVWAFMAPDQLRAMLTGRAAHYGGTSVLVTVLVLVAMAFLYIVVRNLDLETDLTGREQFTLSAEGRQIIAGLAVEPNVPNIRVYAFYSESQSAERDQASALLDDYVATSGNKISYEFVDPDRNPTLAASLEVTRQGALVVAPLNAAGEPNLEQKEDVTFLDQTELSNAILRAAAQGDFRAHFVDAAGTLALTGFDGLGLSTVNDNLVEGLNWRTQSASLLELPNTNRELLFNDGTADGEVVVIAGGTEALPEAQTQQLIDYLNGGGDLVIFASLLKEDGTPVLATTPALQEYLYTNFGLRFADNLVMDLQENAGGTPFFPVISDLDETNFITQGLSGRGLLVFSLSRTIDVNPSLPANVVLTELARSSASSYAKTDPTILTATDIALYNQAETDPAGPFVMAAAAENTQTGARVVLFGAEDFPSNQYQGSGASNLSVALRALFWTTRFDEFFQEIPSVVQPQRAEDVPILATESQLSLINFVSLILLPFGVLVIGGLVWWFNREQARA
jgi:hypothetical protein